MRGRWLAPWLVATALAGCSGERGPIDVGRELELPDQDGDTIMDHHEGTEADDWFDFDGDGTPNRADADSDNDGLPDSLEAGDADPNTFPFDSDNDGFGDFVDLDSDDNCIEDAEEGVEDHDLDGVPNFGDIDDDGDAIPDRVEIGPACDPPDTDADNVPDHRDPDSDGDGIADLYEGQITPFDDTPVDTDGDGAPDYRDLDSDGDGISDSDESGGGPLGQPPRDTDNDGIGDYADFDSDNDGLLDSLETELGTDPYDDDSDGDGYTDGAERSVGTDPLDESSVIEGIYVEVPARTDVTASFDFELSIEQGDIAFVVDTTGSMLPTISALSSEFAQIVGEIAATIPDAQYGVATFEDYNFGTMGVDGQLPFLLRKQITDQTGTVQGILGSLSLNNGGDGPESTVEALRQALSGAGYDQYCDGSFDPETDVRPFLASPEDPFGGNGGDGYAPTVSGGGLIGGMGFRERALPIVVYATDANLRDSDSGLYSTPGGCPSDAGTADVIAASAALGAYLVGIDVGDGTALPEMETLAAATGSVADLDGDGDASELLVFPWSGNDAEFRQTIVGAIQDLVGAVVFEEVTLEIGGDTQGFVIDVDPAVYRPTSSVSGERITFTLTLRGTQAPAPQDELYRLTLDVIGDGTVLLDTLDVFVLVPGASL